MIDHIAHRYNRSAAQSRPCRNAGVEYDAGQYARITSIVPLADRIKLYRLRLEDVTARREFVFAPGQFVMLEVPGIGEAPFSIASSPAQRGEIELGIREVGTLTSFLARMESGIRVGVRGPYGTSFPLEQMQGCDVLFVAGGLGVVALKSPLMAVLGNRCDYNEVALLYGAGSPSGLLFRDEFSGWRLADIAVETIVDKPDQDWSGAVGNITVLLQARINTLKSRRTTSFAIVCGPPVMFLAVCDLLIGAGLPPHHIFVSLERRMHCGRGKCCRCNIGSTYTCIDGPVFNYWSIMNLKEAI